MGLLTWKNWVGLYMRIYMVFTLFYKDIIIMCFHMGVFCGCILSVILYCVVLSSELIEDD